MANKAFQHRYGFAFTGQFASCAFVVLLRKSIPQRTTYKLPLNLALCKILVLTQSKVKEDFMPKEPKPLKIRVLNAACSLTLLASLGYIFFAGANLIVLGAITAALAGVATPVMIDGGGILETVLGVVEALIEGIAAVVEGVCNAISALFSW